MQAILHFLFGKPQAIVDRDAKKKALMKAYFNSRDHKRAIVHAARQSAKDQQRMLDRYHKLTRTPAAK